MSYQKHYERLNPAQRAAVDALDGPVMVVAGPGTGKTEVVGMRVANILRSITGMHPGNILCLTFSTAGAKAMRERLRTIIGPAAYAVTVQTVHGWCNDLILRNPGVFEEMSTLEQVSAIERLRTVRRCIDSLPPGSILTRPSIERDRSAAVASRINEMKREGLHPEDLRKFLDPYRASMDTTKTGKARDRESQAYKDDLRRVRQFEEFIEVYRGYEEEMTSSHRYDTEDMILRVIQALSEQEWLLLRLQEQYQYVIADEFQDFNGAQYRVLDLLTRYATIEHEPNFCIVGDDDQAIYRFQGASLVNMHHFLKRFPQAHIVSLTQSYRCSQKILHAASSVIEKNDERLAKKFPEKISKHLQSSEPGVLPQFLRFPSEGIELGGIARILRSLKVDATPWSSMAILCRRNSEVVAMAQALRAAEIPSIVTAKLDLLREPVTLEIIALLHAVDRIENDATLASALACRSLKVHPVELARVWVTLNKERRSMKEGDSYRSFYEVMLSEIDSFSEVLKKQFLLLLDLHNKRETLTLPALLEELLKGSGILPEVQEKGEDPLRIASIHALYDYVKSRCYERKDLTLPGVLEDLSQIQSEPSLHLDFDVPHLVTDGVQLMTAHAAKGLEFETVIIPHARYGNWGNRRDQSAFALPDHLIYDLDPAIEKTSAQEDERRLFYVAMTRARRHLFFTSSEQVRSGENLRDAQVSAFLAEAGSSVSEESVASTALPEPIDVLYTSSLDLDDAFRAYLKQRLEEFRLSITSLSAFLEDPQRFLWEHLLQQPRAKADHLAYGSCVHRALEAMNLAWKEGRPYSVEELLNVFQQSMLRRELFTARKREEYLHLGRSVLSAYAEEVLGEPAMVLEAERSFSGYLPDPKDQSAKGVPLTGKVDRIDLFEKDGRKCRIVDFKTGIPKATLAAVKKAGQYDQLVFYKLLCEVTPGFLHEATTFALDFVGNSETGRKVVECSIPDGDVAKLKALICTVWEKITALDFTPVERIIWD